MTYAPETVGNIMATQIPTCGVNDSRADIIRMLSGKKWDSMHNVYVVDGKNHLKGVVHMWALFKAESNVTASEIMLPANYTLDPNDDQEKAVYHAIKDDVISIPVIENSGRLIGVVTAHSIIDIMHDEHVEDTLITAGIHGKASNMVKLATERTFMVVRSRAPWLIFGLSMGLALGFITSLFEESLKSTVAIAFFIPVVAYIADSVGTQSVAIAVRALATQKINFGRYVLKELFVGVMLGVLVGVLGGLGATLISHSPRVGVVVALSLLVASSIATVLASTTPMVFKKLGKDPALGSGPIATALQDSISLTVYFLFAMWLL